jgi:hypothetical protein
MTSMSLPQFIHLKLDNLAQLVMWKEDQDISEFQFLFAYIPNNSMQSNVITWILLYLKCWGRCTHWPFL